MRKDSPRVRSIFNNVVTLTMAVVLCGEGVHYSAEHHNPHGNRRERLEELRQRTAETQQNMARTMPRASGGNPPPPEPTLHSATMGRRRMFGLNNAQ